MAGTGLKCKKCDSKFRIIWGSSPEEISKILGRDCDYELTEGTEPEKDLANVVCSNCGGEEFESLPIDEKMELQKEWFSKMVEFDKKSQS